MGRRTLLTVPQSPIRESPHHEQQQPCACMSGWWGCGVVGLQSDKEGSSTSHMASPLEDTECGVPAGCRRSRAPGKQRGPMWATAFELKTSGTEDLPTMTWMELTKRLGLHLRTRRRKNKQLLICLLCLSLSKCFIFINSRASPNNPRRQIPLSSPCTAEETEAWRSWEAWLRSICQRAGDSESHPDGLAPMHLGAQPLILTTQLSC